jgi:hypothetical protein
MKDRAKQALTYICVPMSSVRRTSHSDLVENQHSRYLCRQAVIRFLSFELATRFPLHSGAFPSDYPRGNGWDASRFPEARAPVNPLAIVVAACSTLQAPIAAVEKASIRRAVGRAYARRVREPTSLQRARPPPSQAARAPCFGRPAARQARLGWRSALEGLQGEVWTL